MLSTQLLWAFYVKETLLKIADMALLAITFLLSISAGAAKTFAVPEEVQFLQSFGFNTTIIMFYGSYQMLGGLLLIFHKTKIIGALMAATAFMFSSVLILSRADFIFGTVSLVPVIMALTIAFRHWKFMYNQRLNSDKV